MGILNSWADYEDMGCVCQYVFAGYYIPGVGAERIIPHTPHPQPVEIRYGLFTDTFSILVV